MEPAWVERLNEEIAVMCSVEIVSDGSDEGLGRNPRTGAWALAADTGRSRA
ncbi:MAG: hypothetical protein ACP5RJ_07815 [Conexivisphaera sp.]